MIRCIFGFHKWSKWEYYETQCLAEKLKTMGFDANATVMQAYNKTQITVRDAEEIHRKFFSTYPRRRKACSECGTKRDQVVHRW